ncbi:MAG: hypothetical protein WCA49_03245 [Candidatus Sulfotelmatobacter sp.]
MKESEVKLPVLMMALLVLAFPGLDGILLDRVPLDVASVLEHDTPEFGIKARASRSKIRRIVPLLIQSLARPRVETAAQHSSAKEKLHEYACAGSE